MSPDNRLTRLLAENYHKRLAHSGVDHVLSELRLKYWVPRGRALIKRIVRECEGCKRKRARPYVLPKMGALPPERVQQSEVWQNIGVDHWGP